MSFVSTILFRLYRWSLRHSGAATSTEYVYRTKAIRPEYIGTTLKIQGARPESATSVWVEDGWKHIGHRRLPG